MVAELTLPRLTLDEREAKWSDIYTRREANLSASGDTAYLLVPMADQRHDTGLIVTTLGTEQVDFTYSQSQRVFDFDTPPSYIGPWGIPVINFNQSDEWLETPDAAFWNDSAGSSEPSYCFALWVFSIAGNPNHMLWTKSDNLGTDGQDWVVVLNSSERFIVRIIDDSADAYIGSQTSVLSDGWHHLACTKNDATADNASVITYVDGVADRADQGSGSYTAQEDGTGVVRIGAETDGGSPNGLSILGACLGPIFRAVGTNAVWTPDAIRRDYQLGRALLGPAAGL